jgi:hypothetical protein
MRWMLAAVAAMGLAGGAMAQPPTAERDLLRLLAEATSRLQDFVSREEARIAGVTVASADFLARCPNTDTEAAQWIAARTRQRIAGSASTDLRQLAEAVAGDTGRSLAASSSTTGCQSAKNAVQQAALAEIGDAIRASRRR